MARGHYKMGCKICRKSSSHFHLVTICGCFGFAECFPERLMAGALRSSCGLLGGLRHVMILMRVGCARYLTGDKWPEFGVGVVTDCLLARRLLGLLRLSALLRTAATMA
jgi:hypothetical protein